VLDIEVGAIPSARMRRADKGLLSLALMDARNHTLRWINACERALREPPLGVPELPELNPPLWELGHIGWFQEHWIGRNLQRQRGSHCDPTAPKLASILPHADRWYDSSNVPHNTRWQLDLPGLQDTKQYLVHTLETTLELLEATPDEDDALYFHRLALFHEDMHVEAFAMLAQTLDFDAGLLPPLATMATREPLMFPATRWRLGSARPERRARPPLGDQASDGGGFVFDNEKWGHEVDVPEFEIDAQAVSWAQYCEFVEDGGYDERRFWSDEGWAWVQRLERRTPRHVDQMRQGVLLRRHGKMVRVPLTQPVMHVSWYEADAWCRWAGRRLPAEVEWEAAANQGASRGFRWGDVWEWTASAFRPYPGFTADPYLDYSQPWFGTHKVLRGASFATSSRIRNAKFRNFYMPERDDVFCGFRSCAV
jgi:gamma-glutamyl hercynylcysteine S-oxide synthase